MTRQTVTFHYIESLSFQTATAEWIVWRPTNLSPPAGEEKIFWIDEKKILLFCRIPLKTVSKPPPLPQGRSRQKMVENIMKSKVSRSHSVPASSRPPFTSFSTSPSTPSQQKKGETAITEMTDIVIPPSLSTNEQSCGGSLPLSQPAEDVQDRFPGQFCPQTWRGSSQD